MNRFCTIRRAAVVLAGAVLLSAAMAQAAFAYIMPPHGGAVRTVKAPPLHAQIIVSGGMPGWQTALIAVGAAVAAAVVAVILDRSLVARRHLSHVTA
jgi:hypothetical protein